jgi:hypothetical protein
MKWISVEEFLPGEKLNWVIVRCKNKDIEGFYFMAIHGFEGWDFFNDEDKEGMIVTHWCIPDPIGD